MRPLLPFYNERMQKLTITRPDDWHLHLRDGAALKAVLPYTVCPSENLVS
ncbi:hypothetical protein H6G04_12280 [Calothrix membranacea FACHB-236]|nr:hypothetical protein [Calothrix membranacea FACHB-236]